MKKKFLLSLSLFLTACASEDKGDPHSEFNRDMLELNLAIDENVLRPMATVYKDAASDNFRQSVACFLSNIKEPYYMLNYIVSFDAEHATNSLFRFFINSLFGFLGFFDTASEIGLKKAETSYKDTLHTIGIPTGDYLILPIFGPSSTNYAIAEPISWFCDPITYVIGFPYALAKFAVHAVSDRAANQDILDNMLKGSIDLYSVTKSMYFQKYGSKQNFQENREESKPNFHALPAEFSDSPTPDE